MIERIIERILNEDISERMIHKLSKKILSRLRLPRDIKVELSKELIDNIKSDKFDYYFSGTATVEGQEYLVKCFKYGKNQSVELDTIIKKR